MLYEPGLPPLLLPQPWMSCGIGRAVACPVSPSLSLYCTLPNACLSCGQGHQGWVRYKRCPQPRAHPTTARTQPSLPSPAHPSPCPPRVSRTPSLPEETFLPTSSNRLAPACLVRMSGASGAVLRTACASGRSSYVAHKGGIICILLMGKLSHLAVTSLAQGSQQAGSKSVSVRV